MNQQQNCWKIILIGDQCVDEYNYGSIDRLSPEAPVPVFVSKYIETKPGMAANVCLNLKQFDLDVVSFYGECSTKTRIIDLRSKQHVVRLDNDVRSREIDLTDVKFDNCSAVVISDYDKGSVTYELIDYIKLNFSGPIFIDTKKTDLKRFDGCYVKINQLEYSRCVSINDKLIVTMGENGVLYKSNDKSFEYQSIKVEVADVCGAGDTFLAALVYKFLQTSDIHSAIEFAIKASAVTVQHIGVYAPKLEEIK